MFVSLTILSIISNSSIINILPKFNVSKIGPDKSISLFNNLKTNPKNAQLLFATHDTNLLTISIFRRDQIWFTEKDKYGASKLFSLADFKSDVRKTDKFEENYIKGKYGAVPVLGNFDNLMNPQTLLLHENER